ncbi:MAG: DUF1569 domain-containing protein [Gemmatimonadaceae bacterium]|nr:DUF1569 domain-containing protein [Gemmatimonadaceae bacterium]
MKNVFDSLVVAELVSRINRLSPTTPAAWGKMSVDQMLAHCNVSYEMVYEDKHPRPGPLKSLVLKALVKRAVVGPRPYRRNTPTAPQFKMVSPKDFEQEKQRLIGFLERVQRDGERAFEGRSSHSFGPLSTTEWSTMFYKHLDHHLTQFGV